MPVSKLKNLAILILLFANLALLALVVPARLSTRQESDALHEALCDLYARQEIDLPSSCIPDTASLYVLEVKDSGDADLLAARALLGETLEAEDDSSRYLSLYHSASGTCSISRTGEFSARLEGQPEERDLKAASKKLLKRMGFSHGALMEPQRLRAGVYTVTATQQVLGMPLFSGDLVITWSNNRLTALDGTFFTGTDSLVRVSDTACLSAADALVAFLSARYELGWLGSAVTGLEQGYIRSDTAMAAAVRLTPVWHLETDTGSFLINGMTGEVTGA